MQLKPSEIYFSQAEINNHFDKRSIHRNKNLGDTLDDFVERRCRIIDIPTISVMKRNGRWVTTDNRRLWVFRHLEKLGRCSTITVNQTYFIDSRKMNSTNGGRTVRFYSGRYANSIWHKRVTSIDPGEPKTTDFQTVLNNTTHSVYSRPTFNSYTTGQNSRPLPSNLDSYTTEDHSRPPTTSNVLYGIQSERLTSNMRSLDLKNADLQSELNPSDIRYTKESININTFLTNLEFNLRFGQKNQNDVDPVTIYKAFGKHWVTDGNKRVWSFKQAQSSKTTLKIKADVNDDIEEFLDVIRTERPWLSLIDILQ